MSIFRHYLDVNHTKTSIQQSEGNSNLEVYQNPKQRFLLEQKTCVQCCNKAFSIVVLIYNYQYTHNASLHNNFTFRVIVQSATPTQTELLSCNLLGGCFFLLLALIATNIILPLITVFNI